MSDRFTPPLPTGSGSVQNYKPDGFEVLFYFENRQVFLPHPVHRNSKIGNIGGGTFLRW